jgi:hypothetical protein
MTEPQTPYQPIDLHTQMILAIRDRLSRSQNTNEDVRYILGRMEAAERAAKGYAHIVRNMKALMPMDDILPDVKEAYVDHLHSEMGGRP